MSERKLSSEALCEALMDEICRAIYGGAKRQVDYLRYGPRTLVDEHMGSHMLALAPARLTEQQLEELEAAFRQLQEELVGWLFSVIDGGTKPFGFPDEIRLVNMDTGEAICSGELAWEFSGALVDWQKRLGKGGKQPME